MTHLRSIPAFLHIVLLSLFASCHLAAEVDLGWVLSRYIDAMGGRTRLNEIKSVAIEGKMIMADGMEASLKVMKKRPDLVRTVVLIPPSTRLVNGYDGVTAWQQTVTSSGNVITEMNIDASHPFIRDATLESPLAVEGFDRSKMIYEGVQRIEGNVECYKIRIQYPNGAYLETYLDTSTFYERKTVRHEITDGEEQVNTSIPSDFRFVDGVVFAFRVVNRNADGSRSELILNEIRINPGILNSVFNKPKADGVFHD